MPKLSPKLPPVNLSKDRKRRKQLQLLQVQPRENPPLDEKRRLELVGELRAMSRELMDLSTKLHGILAELTDVLVPQGECPF